MRIPGLLGAGLLALAAACGTAEDPVLETPDADVAVTGQVTPGTMGDTMMAGADTMAVFGEFDRFLATPPQPGLEHEFIAGGLTRLADVLEARMSTAADRTAELRQAAQAIQQDPAAMTHADRVRRALTTAATLIGELPGQAQSGQLTSAAEAIDPARPLLEQTDAVRRFFETARDAI